MNNILKSVKDIKSAGVDYEAIIVPLIWELKQEKLVQLALALAEDGHAEALDCLLYHCENQKIDILQFQHLLNVDNVQTTIVFSNYLHTDKLELLLKHIQNPAVLKVTMIIYTHTINTKVKDLDTRLLQAMQTDFQRIKQINNPYEAMDYFNHQLNLSAQAIVYAIQTWKECSEEVQEIIDNLHTVLMIKDYHKVPAIMQTWKELICYSMNDIYLLDAMTIFYNDPCLLDLLAESNRYDLAKCVLQKIDVTLDFFIHVINEEYWEVLKAIYDTHPQTFLEHLDLLLPQDRDFVLFHSKIGHQRIQHTDIPDVFLWYLKKRSHLTSNKTKKMIKDFLDRTQTTLDELINRENVTAATLALYIYKYKSLENVKDIANKHENNDLLQVIEENKHRL